MNPPTNTGSFMSTGGGMTPELQAAIQRRSGASATPMGGGTPAMNPNAQPPTPPTSQSPMSPGMNPTSPSTGGLPYDPSEMKMLIGAVGNRMKSLSRMQEASAGLPIK